MGGFNTFYLLLNPGAAAADVTVTYLRANRPPRTRTYRVPAGARQTVWVDMERWDDGDSLEAAEVSARIDATAPIIAERAMYLDGQGQVFAAGHDSVGLPAPAQRWLLAEGATGAYFDLFILLANPSPDAAAVRLRFLLGDGTVIEHRETVPAFSRGTVWVDALGRDARLHCRQPGLRPPGRRGGLDRRGRRQRRRHPGGASMWWPGDASTWAEAHNSGGVTATGTRWALADGEVGGPRNTKTYVLVSNPTDSAATVTRDAAVRGPRAPRRNLHGRAPTAASTSRSAHRRASSPTPSGRRVGVLVESTGVPIVVERAMYSDADGQRVGGRHQCRGDETAVIQQFRIQN